MPTHALVCPFLTDDTEFARGVEFGMLYARMRESDEPIGQYITRGNQDQVLLAASRLGWSVAEMRNWGTDWFWCLMEKGPAPVRGTGAGRGLAGGAGVRRPHKGPGHGDVTAFTRRDAVPFREGPLGSPAVVSPVDARGHHRTTSPHGRTHSAEALAARLRS